MNDISQADGVQDQTATDEKGFNKSQIIVFKLDGEEYGVHIDQVKEVVLTPNIAKLPQTPSYIKGVANIRGNVIAVIDLYEKFYQKQTSTKEINESMYYTLVIESDEVKAGILVKEVPNTLAVATNDIEEAVNLRQDSNTENNYIKGIIKQEGRLIVLIDIFKIMETGELFNFLTSSVAV